MPSTAGKGRRALRAWIWMGSLGHGRVPTLGVVGALQTHRLSPHTPRHTYNHMNFTITLIHFHMNIPIHMNAHSISHNLHTQGPLTLTLTYRTHIHTVKHINTHLVFTQLSHISHTELLRIFRPHMHTLQATALTHSHT